MAYPNDAPAESLSDYQNSGYYTPAIVCAGLVDNVTPVNKNTLRNTLGSQISRVQNYVNGHYLAREDIPINSGWITNVYSNTLSGDYINANSGNFTNLTCDTILAQHSGEYGVTFNAEFLNTKSLTRKTGTRTIWTIGDGNSSIPSDGGFELVNYSGDIILENQDPSGNISISALYGYIKLLSASGIRVLAGAFPSSNPGPNIVWVDASAGNALKLGS